MKVYIKQLGIYSIIALFFVLAACGPQEDSGEKAGGEQEGSKNSEYDLLVWEDVEKSEGIEDAIQKFEEENDVTIKVVEETYAQQIEKLRLDGPAGTGQIGRASCRERGQRPEEGGDPKRTRRGRCEYTSATTTP